jgi:hypothetical protein
VQEAVQADQARLWLHTGQSTQHCGRGLPTAAVRHINILGHQLLHCAGIGRVLQLGEAPQGSGQLTSSALVQLCQQQLQQQAHKGAQLLLQSASWSAMSLLLQAPRTHSQCCTDVNGVEPALLLEAQSCKLLQVQALCNLPRESSF